MFSIKSKFMKKVIYFFTLTLLLSACNISKSVVYDDVYETADLTPSAEIDKAKGYSDYIKNEEHKYKIEPEEDHYTYSAKNYGSAFQNSMQYNNNNGFVNQQNYSVDYYCNYHRIFHSHAYDTYYCSDWAYHSNYGVFGPHSAFNYRPYGTCYSPYNSYYSYNYFNNGYSGYNSYLGWNGYSYYNGYNYNNYYPNNAFNYDNNTNNNNNGIFSGNTAGTNTSSNYHYGHRNGRAQGTQSNNTTVYAQTVKSAKQIDEPIFETIKVDHIAMESKYVSSTSNTGNAYNSSTITTNNPQNTRTIKPLKTTSVKTHSLAKSKFTAKTNTSNKSKPNNYSNSNNSYTNKYNDYAKPQTNHYSTQPKTTTTYRTTNSSSRSNTNSNSNHSYTRPTRTTNHTTTTNRGGTSSSGKSSSSSNGGGKSTGGTSRR